MKIRQYFLVALLLTLGLGQNVGIGTNAPTERLHVAGNLRIEGAFMPGGQSGSTGNILLSQGAGTSPVWLANGAVGDILTMGSSGPTWAPNPICASPTQDRHLRVAATTPTLSVCNSTLAENATGNIWNADGNGSPFATGDKFAIIATGTFPNAINGYATTGIGVRGQATGANGRGVYGEATGTNGRGVYGEATGTNGRGVYGTTNQATGIGVQGENTSANGTAGLFVNTATAGTGTGSGARIISRQRGGSALVANLRNDGSLSGTYFINTVIGAYHMGGLSSGFDPPIGIAAEVASNDNYVRAIIGQHRNNDRNVNAFSVFGYMDRTGASIGTNWAVGVFGQNPYAGTNDWAVYSNGWFGATSKAFLIDHPLDPENKYLLHATVEGPEPYNLYRGVVTTDASGRAVVHLPDYFEAANKEFSYYLQPIGTFAQVIVEEEVRNNEFVIRTDKPNVKVSWMVVATRDDPYMRYFWKPTVIEKSPEQRGKYLIPQVYGKDDSYGIFPGPVPSVKSPERSMPALPKNPEIKTPKSGK